MNAAMAVKAYGAAMGGGATKAIDAQPTSEVDFGAMVQSAMQNATQSTQNAESMMTAHMQGKAELIDAVTAISAAETSLQSVIAIRDQVISAYQEIMRMPI